MDVIVLPFLWGKLKRTHKLTNATNIIIPNLQRDLWHGTAWGDSEVEKFTEIFPRNIIREINETLASPEYTCKNTSAGIVTRMSALSGDSNCPNATNVWFGVQPCIPFFPSSDSSICMTNERSDPASDRSKNPIYNLQTRLHCPYRPLGGCVRITCEGHKINRFLNLPSQSWKLALFLIHMLLEYNFWGNDKKRKTNVEKSLFRTFSLEPFFNVYFTPRSEWSIYQLYR